MAIDSKAGQFFINGKYKSGKTTFPLTNPATGAKVLDVSEASAEDVDEAVAAAKAAQPGWAAIPVQERGRLIRKLADLIRRDVDILAEMDTLSMGKPISFGAGDNGMCATFLDYYASLAEANPTGWSSTKSDGFMNVAIKEPYGVCAGIIPWNATLTLWAWKIGPAVAAGNTIVLKSSEKAPLTSSHMGALATEAGFPPGVINILSGGGVAGKLLAENMTVRKISFTGSARTGRLVMEAAAKSNLKAVTLELGGKSPVIIFPDADLDKAAKDLAFSLGFNSGQICMATTRVYVHADVAKDFTQRYVAQLKEYAPKDPMDTSSLLGPVADAIQAKTVAGFLETGRKEGKLALGGDKVQGKDNFFNPTVFTDVAHDANINKNEIFGPVSIVHIFTDEDEAIRLANDTEYGLYASLYTADFARMIRVGKALQAGAVAVNATSPTLGYEMPFGGVKQSGLGREGGPNALDAWTETKSLMMAC